MIQINKETSTDRVVQTCSHSLSGTILVHTNYSFEELPQTYIPETDVERTSPDWDVGRMEFTEPIEHGSTVIANDDAVSAHTDSHENVYESSGLVSFEFVRGRIRQPKADIILMPGKTLIIGRNKQSEVALAGDPTLSSKHLKLCFRNNFVTIFDLESTNGTYVNGVRIEECKIMHGDEIRLGSCVFKANFCKSFQTISHTNYKKIARSKKPTRSDDRRKLWQMTCEFRSAKNLSRRVIVKDRQCVSFGNTNAADFKVDDPEMQQLHFSLSLNGPNAKIKNLSQNGETYVNGVRIYDEKTVSSGVITVGRSQFTLNVVGCAISESNNSRRHRVSDPQSSAETVKGI